MDFMVTSSSQENATVSVSCEKIHPEVKRPRIETESFVHPLLMDHVIEAIFDYAAFSNNFCEVVRQFRLVNKLWCKIATKKFRDLLGQIDFENDFDRGTARFIEVMQNCDDIPFKSFKFTGGFVLYKSYRGDYSYDRIFEKLLSVCSPAIQELEFSTHNPSDLKFPKLLRGIRFDNLRILNFKMCVYYDRLQSEMPSLLNAFFKASPRLEKLELTVTTPDGETTDDQLELIEIFGDLIVSRLPKSCKHLKLNMPFTNYQLEQFGFQNIFLDSLNVDFRNSPVSTASLVKFLESQQHTLRDLQLIECPVRIVKDTLHFPCLMRLRIEGRAILPCFSFKKVFPALQTFEVVFYWIYQEDKWLSNVFNENTYSDSVRQLKICCWVTDSDSQIFQRVSRNFPRLRKLQLNVDSFAVLREIFKIMGSIEELEMSLGLEFWRKNGCEVDSVFTGLPPEYITEKREILLDCTDFPSTWSEPSLRNMQKLSHLKIVAFQADEVKLTDITVHYGFMKMKSLKRLTIDVFPISEGGIASLKEFVHLTILPDRRHRPFFGC